MGNFIRQSIHKIKHKGENNMKFKSLTASIICAAMMASSVSFAETISTETIESPAISELPAETNSESIYAEFPMSIDKTIEKDMGMSLHLQYEKDMTDIDEVAVTIVDFDSKDIIFDESLTEDNDYICLSSVENDKTYLVEVSETTDGVSETYAGMIKTKYVPTDFPVNMTLGNKCIENNQGETFSHILMKKVGDNPSCNHEEDEECNENCSIASKITKIMPEELNTFYSTLDSNCFYELQVKAYKGERDTRYAGYISTYPGGEDMGIFTRGFSFSKISNETNMETALMNISNEFATYSTNSTRAKDLDSYGDFADAFEYVRYIDMLYEPLNDFGNRIIKWIVPEYGSYIIETVGNVDTLIYMFNGDSNGDPINSPSIERDGGAGENVRIELQSLAGEVFYFVTEVESGDRGNCAFRIKRVDDDGDSIDPDGISGYESDVKAMYGAGTFSNALNPNCEIAYDGDTDIFVYDANTGEGWMEFINPETTLKVKVSSVVTEGDYFDDTWQETTFTVNQNTVQYLSVHDFSSDVYYIDVRQSSVRAQTNSGYLTPVSYDYGFNFYDAKHKDSLEGASNATNGDNYPIYAHDITSELPNYECNNQLTIHKGDSDWFKFTTGPQGGDLEIKIYETEPSPDNQNIIDEENETTSDATYEYTYTAYIYEDVVTNEGSTSWSSSGDIANIELVENGERTYCKATVDDMLPNNTYYIRIRYNRSSQYSSYHTYDLSINVSSPSAVLNGNVTLSHTVGTALTDLSAFYNTVMESLTCYDGSTAIDDTIALNDVTLYYNNAELTADVVNSLSAGPYPIVVKYKGIEATGGTVTLNVTTGTSNRIILNNITRVEAIEVEWDWAAAAKMAADNKLIREGKSASTKVIQEAIIAVNSEDLMSRATIDKTVSAAKFFYNDGASTNGYSFVSNNINVDTAENELYNHITAGKAVIMLLTSTNDPTDMSLARYVVLCGIDIVNHQYGIIDPFDDYIDPQTGSNINWYDQSIFYNGGYAGNSDLRFTGKIIEFL